MEKQLNEPLVEHKTSSMTFGKMVFILNMAQFFITCNDTLQKDTYVNRGATIIDYALIRSLTMFPIAWVLLRYAGQPYCAAIQPHQWKFLIVRSLICTCGIFLCNFSFSIVPITTFTILLNMAPFFTSLLAHFFLNETVSLFEIFAMTCSFGGIALIAFAQPAEQPTGNIFAGMAERPRYLMGLGAAVLMSFLYAVYLVCTRFLKELHPSVLFFYE